MRLIVEMENSGLVYMLINDKISGILFLSLFLIFLDLHSLYELLKRVNEGIKVMTETMSSYLRIRGRNLITEGAGGSNEVSSSANLASTSSTEPPKQVQVDPAPATINAPILNPISFIQVIFKINYNI